MFSVPRRCIYYGSGIPRRIAEEALLSECVSSVELFKTLPCCDKTITLIMWSSSAVSVGLGLMAEAPLWMLTLVTILYGMLLTGDSASITAGAVAEAPTGYKGATLAVHSCIGFIGSFLGPLIFGVALDVASPTYVGGTTVGSWS